MAWNIGWQRRGERKSLGHRWARIGNDHEGRSAETSDRRREPLPEENGRRMDGEWPQMDLGGSVLA